eukprot:2902200-Prymnesium_polylepis.1
MSRRRATAAKQTAHASLPSVERDPQQASAAERCRCLTMLMTVLTPSPDGSCPRVRRNRLHACVLVWESGSPLPCKARG